MPSNRLTASLSSGCCMFRIASTFFGSAFRESAAITCPKYVTSLRLSLILLGLSLRFISLQRSSTCLRRRSCCSSVAAYTIRSSIKTSTPSRSLKCSTIVLWNTSGADVIPYGRRRKRYLPNGVANVVRWLLASSRPSCMKPDVASRVVKYFEPCSLLNISSAVGNE